MAKSTVRLLGYVMILAALALVVLAACGGSSTGSGTDRPAEPPLSITNKGQLTIPVGSGIGINPATGKMTFEVAPGFHIEP